jgi:hypothetical protein
VPRSPLRALIVPILLLAACDHPTQPSDTAGAELAAVAFTIQSDIPFNVTQFVPCGNGGAGQDVVFSGNIHDVLHVTQTPSGQLTVKAIDNPQGVIGIGQVDGAIYHGTGMTQSTFTTRFGQASTLVNRFHLVSSGPGGSFVVYETSHFTINANGTVTTVIDNVRVECQ